MNKENISSAMDPTIPPVDQSKRPVPKAELLCFGTGPSNENALQKNFERFRKAKKDEIKYRNYVAKQTKQGTRDESFKKQLREKFVETAKKYFGVPYAKRYWQPGEELYDSPIFLDCCALVRQVVYDLRDEFGFQLDRWNQAYQVDTLPIALKFEEMKPGDLIFYSGTYFNTKLRAQKHDMVHVEIFTGGETGE
jgi:cell wall-associated NlpC family hydrolase